MVDEVYGAFLVEVADADRDGAGDDCFQADPKPPEPETLQRSHLLTVNSSTN